MCFSLVPIVNTQFPGKLACFLVPNPLSTLLGQLALEIAWRYSERFVMRVEMRAEEAAGVRKRSETEAEFDGAMEQALTRLFITEALKQRTEYMALTAATITAVNSGLASPHMAAHFFVGALIAELSCDIIVTCGVKASIDKCAAEMDCVAWNWVSLWWALLQRLQLIFWTASLHYASKVF